MGQSTLVSMWGYGHCLCPAELLIITLIHVMIPSWDTWRGPKALRGWGDTGSTKELSTKNHFFTEARETQPLAKYRKCKAQWEAWGLCEIIGCPGIWWREQSQIAQHSWVCQAEARSHQEGIWDIWLLPHLGGGRDSYTVSTLESIGFLHSC